MTLSDNVIAMPRRASKTGSTQRRIGLSHDRRSIDAYTFARGSDVVLVLAGVHGDEPKSVFVARRFMEHLSSADLRDRGSTAVVVPVVNPDGYERRRRRNAAGTDINRNFPTADWEPAPKRRRYYPGSKPASEPETRAIIRLIESLRPDRIVTIHSIDGHRYCNNYDGPGLRLARGMARRNGYPVRSTIGYRTPGSFGTWVGVERGIPIVTLELPSHHSPQRCWKDNRSALLFACA